MRLKFDFLNDKYNRPTCFCIINGVRLRCLFDTGAGVNVVCMRSIIPLFGNDCRFLKKDYLGGFGGLKKLRDVYEFNSFVLGEDGFNGLTYRKLISFVDDMPDLGCDIVLSSSMFTECILTVDYLNRYVYVDSEKTNYSFSIINSIPYVCSSI